MYPTDNTRAELLSDDHHAREHATDMPPGASTWVKTPMRGVWFAIGFSSIALGALGILLPLLPTTPFLLLAAFAFARSSQRWHDWLHQHRVFGPVIDDWNRYGAIDRRSKIIGTSSMIAVFALSVALKLNSTILLIQAVALSCSAAFVLSRPSPPE